VDVRFNVALEFHIVPRTDRYPFRSDLRARLIDVATRGETINYLALGVGRAMVGRYLYRIAHEEATAGRPPLTSVVVHKGSGVPGAGFLEAMVWVKYIPGAAGETERSVWDRALRETHDYWRPKLQDDLK
jgi:hypothetical protein